MELLPTPDNGGTSPVAPRPDLDERLAAIERRIEAMSDRLARLEASLGPTVAHEVKGVTSELARAITELGRRLALDLPHELRRHRDVIVSELRPPPPPPPTPPPPAPEVDDATTVVDPEDTDAEPDGDDGSAGAEAGRRVPRRRRRHG